MRWALVESRAPWRPAPATVVFDDVEVEGRPGCRVGVAEGRIAFVAATEERPGRPGDGSDGPVAAGALVVDGGGGALLPGLHDHHLHLLAMAARATSVDCGPPGVVDRAGLGRRLRTAAAALAASGRGQWLRGVGYDDTRIGTLDAVGLDDLLGEHRHLPVRVQHRSGHRWVLNTAAVDRVRDAVGTGSPGEGHGAYLDRDLDLRRCWAEGGPPDLSTVGRHLARLGITGVTDATVTNAPDDLVLMAGAQRSGSLPQRVLLLGSDTLSEGDDGDDGDEGEVEAEAGLDAAGECMPMRPAVGAHKVVLAEHDLPGLEDLVATIAGAGRRGVAVHCASREALVLAAVALRAAPSAPARLEHAAVAPPEVLELLAGLPATVVTQPGFVRAHGERYRSEVAPDDLPWLYRLAGWRAAGIPLAAGSDAPFGPVDPWAGMRAATDRRTAGGAVLGPDEALSPERARDLYLGRLDDPGGPPRRVERGAAADLVLLSVPWGVARHELDAGLVRTTMVAGSLSAD